MAEAEKIKKNDFKHSYQTPHLNQPVVYPCIRTADKPSLQVHEKSSFPLCRS